MAPSAVSASIKPHSDKFDASTLFVADKDAAKSAAESLASMAKNEDAEFFGSIGLPDALVKVS